MESKLLGPGMVDGSRSKVGIVMKDNWMGSDEAGIPVAVAADVTPSDDDDDDTSSSGSDSEHGKGTSSHQPLRNAKTNLRRSLLFLRLKLGNKGKPNGGDSEQKGEGTAQQQPPQNAETNLRTLLFLRRKMSNKIKPSRAAKTAPKGWAETEEGQNEEAEARKRYSRAKKRFRNLLATAGEQYTELEELVRKAGPKIMAHGIREDPGLYAEFLERELRKTSTSIARHTAKLDEEYGPSFQTITCCNVLLCMKNKWPLKALGSPSAGKVLDRVYQEALPNIEGEVTEQFLPHGVADLPARSLAVYKLTGDKESYVLTFRATGCLSDWATDVMLISQVVENFTWTKLIKDFLSEALETVRRVVFKKDLTKHRSVLEKQHSVAPTRTRGLLRSDAHRDMPLDRLRRTLDAVQSIIEQRPDAIWTFTGWSLGGCLALHCGHLFLKRSWAFGPLITSPTLLQHSGNIIINDIDDTAYRMYSFRIRPERDNCTHIKAHAGNPPFNHMLADLVRSVLDSEVPLP